MADLKLALHDIVKNGLRFFFDELFGNLINVFDGHVSKFNGLVHGIIGEVDKISDFLLFCGNDLRRLLNGLDFRFLLVWF